MSRNPINFKPARAGRVRGFTLVEIMIVVAILGVILAIAAPTWVRQRMLAQQRVCQENLFKIEGAKEQWALETHQPIGTAVLWSHLVQGDGSGYIKRQPECPSGGSYELNNVGMLTACTTLTPYNHNDAPKVTPE